MYNRYIPPGTAYAPIPEEESSRPESEVSPGHSRSHSHPTGGVYASTAPHNDPSNGGTSDLLGSVTSGISDLLGGIFKNFSLENLDSGDILLILIILFLFLEGDNLDLVIALGLMLLLGLGEREDAQPSDE